MSPTSQGNLEVERYIGSCLISSTLRVNSTNGGSGSVVINTSHHKGKKLAESGGSPRPVKLLNVRPGPCQEHYHNHHGAYNGVVPLCECGGPRYGSSGRSWAGMPLISMASGSRRNRKPSSSVSGVKGSKGNEGEQQQTRTPLSRLAIHTQGAPLILAGRYNSVNRKKNMSNNPKGAPARQYPTRKYNSAKDNLATTRESGGVNNTNTPSSDNLSVASDESSGHSENSLPRIIKPRKRRKKDRKPPPSNISPTTESTKALPSEQKSQESSNIVTLKPYVPICYELYDPSFRRDGGVRRKPWEVPPLAISGVVDDEGSSQTSEEDAQDPKLHHEFDDVEEEEDGDALSLDANALFPFLCSSKSLCQCRYCDPAGLIWDVDQNCYSPFLTPPSPGNEKSFTTSPLANIPLFLNPPLSESPSFDLFDNKESVFITDGEIPSLRRSWNDSSSGFPSLGISRVWGDRSERLGSTSSDGSSVSITASQSLEVSTEIVTSPNGHRDIEIKFYSSSPPTVTGGDSNNKQPAEGDVNNVMWSKDDNVNVWGCERSLWGVEKNLVEEVNQLRHVEE